MSTLEKYQTLIIFTAMMAGLFFGQFTTIEENAEPFIVPFLLLMLYGLFLTIPLESMKKSWTNGKFLSTSIGINFIWTPLLAWGLGAIFLSDHPALWIGFIMLMVTPCTDWYLVFTSIAKGNVALATSVLPINLVLQVVLLPVYLLIFAGSMQLITIETVLYSVMLVFILPFLLAQLTRLFLSKQRMEKTVSVFANLQIVFLSLAIAAMFASQGRHLIENLDVIWLLLLPILLFFLVNYFVGQATAKWLQFGYADRVSLQMTIIARNSPIALAIAVTAFPDTPLVALALVIGPLIELPILALISQMIKKGW